MEKGAAGCPSLPTHHGLTNPGISRDLASRLPYGSLPRGGGRGDHQETIKRLSAWLPRGRKMRLCADRLLVETGRGHGPQAGRRGLIRSTRDSVRPSEAGSAPEPAPPERRGHLLPGGAGPPAVGQQGLSPSTRSSRPTAMRCTRTAANSLHRSCRWSSPCHRLRVGCGRAE